jgi:two-component sensor histidine kinase
MAPSTTAPADFALSLALAVISSSDTPLVLLDSDMVVVMASRSFCRTFRIDPVTAAGQPLTALGKGEWNIPQLTSLLTATASGFANVDAYEMDINLPGKQTRHLVLNAHKIDYDDAHGVRLMLSVADVTEARHDARLKDELIRDKAILLDEIQHRVANSLQIIASVLLQSARKVSSVETRDHLKSAHGRVMSVAAVQRQLSTSGLEDVELRPYFTQLCQSLGASMISDADQLSIKVSVDESVVRPEVSVSLGLIVTELVINALKHAFPNHRHGEITVGYRADGQNWTLEVSDNGVGMPKSPHSAKAGLGTSLVESLAKQRHAQVQVADAHPGTIVLVVHTQAAAVNDEAEELSAEAV